MRIVVFGANGMLGRAVTIACLQAGHKPVPFTHAECDISNQTDIRIRLGIARSLVGEEKIGAVINCAGVRPGGKLADMGLTNAAGPHVIQSVLEGISLPVRPRLIHVSTDCVFDGHPEDGRIRNTIADKPDNTDDNYGRTKIAGEPSGPGVVTVRTSFIGLESGLLAWLLSHPRGFTVPGWTNAQWTGSTAPAVARALVKIAVVQTPVDLLGGALLHLATPEILSKLDAIKIIDEQFDLGLNIVATNEPRLNRALSADVALEPFDKALGELVETWKHSNAAKAKA